MSSSANSRQHRRVLRESDAGMLPMASVVSPHGTLIVHADAELNAAAAELRARDAAERSVAFDDGYAAALSDVELRTSVERTETVKIMAVALRQACAAVMRDRRAIVDEVVADAVDLAFELLEVLLGDELAHRDSPVRSAVARALALAPDGEDVRVRVHPGTDLAPAELEALASVGSVSVLVDPSIEPTGCVVEAGACRIDAQLGSALDRVRAVLDEVRSHHAEVVLK